MIINELGAFPGDIGAYYKRLDGSETIEYNADMPLIAASVIKIPIMIEAFRRMQEGTLEENMRFFTRREQFMPSCGALTYMHEGLSVTLMDLITLMIILSDNTATNMLIDILGIDAVNETMRSYGVTGSALRRKLFDTELAGQGINNRVTARDMGVLLEGMYNGRVVSPGASESMLNILKNQRLNGKIPFFLHGVKVAHKTGEDDNITHDVGIVYADRPFILCMLSNNVDAPLFNRLIQDAAKELAER